MNSTRAGQTLLESLLAIGIILVGVVSLISLLISLNQTAASTLSQSVATQLAAEGLEAVHFIRDSNWLKIEDGQTSEYYDGLRSSTGDYEGIYRWDRTAAVPDDAITIAVLPGSDITTTEALVYQDASGYFRQDDSAPPADWTATKYRRWITLYPVCRDTTAVTTTTEQVMTVSGSDCGTEFGSSYEEIGIKVKVTVQWPEPGRTVNYVIEEILYNWKYAQP